MSKKMSENQKTCPHSVLFGNICVKCGAVVDKKYEIRADPNSSMVTVSTEEAKRESEELEKYLISKKKLCLVIDLDKTLIDTATVHSQEEVDQIIASDTTCSKNDFIFLKRQMLLVRVRPYVKNFLHDISPYFRMQIYTLAAPDYANQILHVIDPTNEFFGRRIFSRSLEDDQEMAKQRRLNPGKEILYEKDIKKLFPFSDRFVLVLDDTPGVWYCDKQDPFFPSNERKIFKGLVQIKPFEYFNQPIPRAVATITKNGSDDDILIQMKDVLIDVHHRFYENFDPEESHVLISLKDRKSITFDSMYFLFDRVKDLDKCSKEAEEFGATVLDSFEPYVTHIIVGSGGTNDVIAKAMEYNGIYVVTIDWFVQSRLQFCRIEESKYKLVGIPCPTEGDIEREAPPTEEILDIDSLFGDDDDKNEQQEAHEEKIISYDDISKDPDWLKKIEEMPDDDDDNDDE